MRLEKRIEKGLALVAERQEQVRQQAAEVQRVQATLDSGTGSNSQRKERFEQIQQELAQSADPVRRKMAGVMLSFLVGLFVGVGAELPVDNQELERWIRLPKGQERRIHGRRHAGVRLVQEGATLMLVLDAHQQHPGPFSAAELQGYRYAQPPPAQQEAMHRRKIMRRARSKKKRALLLAQLEQRFLDAS